MTLAPLLQASPAIQVHALAAVTAFVLGGIQIAGPKGTLQHRAIGTVWAVLMVGVAISAFFIHQLRVWGPWSPIHILAAWVLVSLPLALWRAHKHDIPRHRRAMLSLYLGALLIAGLFTFLPGRIMHAVVFGG